MLTSKFLITDGHAAAARRALLLAGRGAGLRRASGVIGNVVGGVLIIVASPVDSGALCARIPGVAAAVLLTARGGLLEFLVMRCCFFDLGPPVAEIVFRVVEDLASLCAALVGWADVAWYDGRVVEQLEETHAVAREDDLLLGALDGGEELGVVGFLQLLACLIPSFSNLQPSN